MLSPPSLFRIACRWAALLWLAVAARATEERYDVVVYGATPAGITAALQAKKMGMRTVLVSPDHHIGGMITSGLGWTDSKDGDAIGGLAREFHHRIWREYREPSAWPRGDRAAYAPIEAQPGPAIDDRQQVMWTFEPKVAERVLEAWLAEASVEIARDERLDRGSGVNRRRQRILSIRLLSGRVLEATVFVDASYEGDLMAAAGVSYRVGRDAADEYDESLNGVFFEPPDARYYQDGVLQGISPYVRSDDASSGLIAGIEGLLGPRERPGSADQRLQAFNFRLCLTDDSSNRVPIERPEKYDEAEYELLFRLHEAGHPSGFATKPMPNAKTDANSSGPMGLDFVGGSYSVAGGWNYSEASYEQRQKIVDAHRAYAQGLLWTLMNHPRIPEAVRERSRRFGLARDEFTGNGHWPYQPYVREARRLVGMTVMTQHHVEKRPGYLVADSIGLGSYSLDSHVVRRVVVNGRIRSEGGFYVWRNEPYPISYGAIVPRHGEAENLLVPVTLSATHAAFGSLRMEPTYMILGQSAGTAAALAVRGGVSVQDVPYALLREQLLRDGQRLEPAWR